MTITLDNLEAIAEIEQLMSRFGLTAEEVVERVIIDAGVWMPMETLANSFWEGRRELVSETDVIPSWHKLVTTLPVFTKYWSLQITSHPPRYELTHTSGVRVSLSVYDSLSCRLWATEPGLWLRLHEFGPKLKFFPKPMVTIPSGVSKTPSQRQSMIAQARRIVAEIDPLAILSGSDRDDLLRHIGANRAENAQWFAAT